MPLETQEQREAAMWRKLIGLAGYWQNGSETLVTLAQDDATRTCFLKVGKATYYGNSFAAALSEAPEPDPL